MAFAWKASHFYGSHPQPNHLTEETQSATVLTVRSHLNSLRLSWHSETVGEGHGLCCSSHWYILNCLFSLCQQKGFGDICFCLLYNKRFKFMKKKNASIEIKYGRYPNQVFEATVMRKIYMQLYRRIVFTSYANFINNILQCVACFLWSYNQPKGASRRGCLFIYTGKLSAILLFWWNLLFGLFDRIIQY